MHLSGLHCSPIVLASQRKRWLYCFLIHLRNNTDNTFVKIILEKQNDVLLEFFLETFLNACFRVGSVLDDVRAAVMFDTNRFTYDSIRRFMNDLRRFKCTSHRVIWCTSQNMFASMYK